MEKVLRTENLEQGHTESVTGLNEAADEVDDLLVAEVGDEVDHNPVVQGARIGE